MTCTSRTLPRPVAMSCGRVAAMLSESVGLWATSAPTASTGVGVERREARPQTASARTSTAAAGHHRTCTWRRVTAGDDQLAESAREGGCGGETDRKSVAEGK